MKRLLYLMLATLVVALALFPASSALATNNGQPPALPQSDDVCYENGTVTTNYGECPEGSTVNPNDPTSCLTPTYEYSCASHTYTYQTIDVAGHWDYQNKIQVVDEAGHWECDNGWTLYDTNKCKKFKFGQWHYENADWVPTTYKYVCPDGYEKNPGHSNCRKWVPDTYKTIEVNFSYDKWDNDPNKCHRPTANSLGIPSGQPTSGFNTTFPEWEDSVVTQTGNTSSDRPISSYSCDDGYTLGQTNGQYTCTKQVTCPQEAVCTNLDGGPYYQVPDGYHDFDGVCLADPLACNTQTGQIESYFGDLPDGWTSDLSDPACNPVDPEEDPEPATGRSCNGYLQELINLGHPERIDNIPRCANAGSDNWWDNLIVYLFGQ